LQCKDDSQVLRSEIEQLRRIRCGEGVQQKRGGGARGSKIAAALAVICFKVFLDEPSTKFLKPTTRTSWQSFFESKQALRCCHPSLPDLIRPSQFGPLPALRTVPKPIYTRYDASSTLSSKEKSTRPRLGSVRGSLVASFMQSFSQCRTIIVCPLHLPTYCRIRARQHFEMMHLTYPVNVCLYASFWLHSSWVLAIPRRLVQRLSVDSLLAISHPPSSE
jgi:hypothetical protein